jgi:ribosome biogenesis GTPase / thiamine phosphate phosphatase
MSISKEIKTIKLEDLGFNDFFASNRNKLGLDDFAVARVIAEHKGAYRVKNENGEYLARVTGKQIFSATSREDYPAVGDFVAITALDKELAVIHRVLPRRTIIKRKYSGKNEIQIIAANVDVAFVIESVDRDYNLNRFERYFSIASGGIKFAIILNKIDLISKEKLDFKLAQIKDRFNDIDVILTSTIADKGLDAIKNYIEKGETYCFLGSSGVGKSSLINKLLGENIVKTGDVSLYSSRGKHVTTAREMYFLDNGVIVIDNPGMREVGMADSSTGVEDVFDEIAVLAKKCKYTDCTHTHEPGCEVLLAVNSNKLDKDKYTNYLSLKKEAEYYELTELEKKEKNRKFGKFIKKAKDELKKYGHKGNL